MEKRVKLVSPNGECVYIEDQKPVSSWRVDFVDRKEVINGFEMSYVQLYDKNKYNIQQVIKKIKNELNRDT